MMSEQFFGYILIHRPPTLTAARWQTALTGTAAELDAAGEISKSAVVGMREQLDKRREHPQPSHRVHSRESVDGSKIILHAEFDSDDLKAGRLAEYINAATGEKIADEDVKFEILDADAVRALIAKNKAEWGEETQVEVSR